MTVRALILAAVAAAAIAGSAEARPLWTKAEAHTWYDRQPWMVGTNYNPASAINEIEMWHPDTFSPEDIDRELGWAAKIGMNTKRVFLHNLLWENDAPGLKKRIDQFLAIAAKHKIRIMFVLFDSCWDPDPKYGLQHPPIPGVHNSGWVQAPGAARLKDASQYGKLEAYVKDIVGSFAKDDRILAWDVWNEPDNAGGGNYAPTPDKEKYVELLLGHVFEWARSADPTQPLTSGLWKGEDWDQAAKLNPIQRIQIAQSDINSFHDYNWPETFERRANQMLSHGRPVLCTEFLARGSGSNFDTHLPIAKKLNIAMYSWGFVDGRTQTRLPWDSWKKPYTLDQPTVWFHEVLRADGMPYRQSEVDLMKRLMAAPKKVVP